MLCQEAMSLHELFRKAVPETNDTKPFNASKGCLHRFKNRIGLKKILKLLEKPHLWMKKLLPHIPQSWRSWLRRKVCMCRNNNNRKKNSIYRIWYYLQFHASTGGLGTYPLWIRRDYCTEEIRYFLFESKYSLIQAMDAIDLLRCMWIMQLLPATRCSSIYMLC